MNFLRHFRLPAAGLLALCLFFSSVIPLEAQDKDLTLEDLAKTEAAQFFIKKQYQKSLEAFQKLEAEHPKNVLIKRYIASLYDSLQQRDLAIQKLQEALALNPTDRISRQMLGDLFVKQGNLDQAEKEFRQLLQEAGPESATGAYARQKLESIQKIRSVPQASAGKQLGAEEFMRSDPAQDFAKGKYENALRGFDALLAAYPDDPLIHRFRAIALLRIKRTDEAVAAFHEGLKIAPDNMALHFYLGEAYGEIGNSELARKEYQIVIAQDRGNYQMRAKRAIFQLLGGPKPPVARPWSLSFTNGYEFDTNATYKSRDDRISEAGDQNSSRFNTSLLGTYRFYQKKSWFLTSDAFYSQSLYSDFPNLRTYTWGGGVSALRVLNFFGRTSFLNIRDGVAQTYLARKFYVFSQTLSPNWIVNLTDKIRASLAYRFTVNEYQARGTSPDLTNRDGLSNGASMAGTYYFDNAKKNYFTLGYDFDYDRTKGVNYVKRANTGRTEFHWALPAQIEFNLSFRYKDSYYPKYASGPPSRWDHQYTLTPSLSRPVFRDSVVLTATYTYEATPARDNTYEYYKHIFGIQLSLKY